MSPQEQALKKIMSFFFKETRPARVQGPWEGVSPLDKGVRVLSDSTAALQKSLSEEFSESQLKAAQVLASTVDGELGLHPVLKGMSQPTLFLLHAKQESIWDIVNESGSLRGFDPPALSCHRDRLTQRLLSEQSFVLVPFSDGDLQVYRGLGLPCTPAVGLAQLEGNQFRRLVKQQETPQLVLAAWDISRLEVEVPDLVQDVVNRLLAGEDAYGWETSRCIRVWAPTEQEFQELCAAASFKDQKLVRQRIVESLGASTYSISEFAEEIAARNPPSYTVARRGLLKTLAEARALGYEHPEIAAKLQEFNRAHSNDVVDAHLQAAQSATDPKEKSLHVIGAEFMERLHASSYLVRAAQEQRQGIEPSSAARLHPEEWDLRLGLIDRYVKISRELQRKS